MATKSRNTMPPVEAVEVIQNYDAAADSKNRISLRGAQTKHFHVKVLSNGSFILEPRILVPPDAVSKRTLKMLDQSVSSLKAGNASVPIDLAKFIKS